MSIAPSATGALRSEFSALLPLSAPPCEETELSLAADELPEDERSSPHPVKAAPAIQTASVKASNFFITHFPFNQPDTPTAQ
jgi:hypothetical protein